MERREVTVSRRSKSWTW